MHHYPRDPPRRAVFLDVQTDTVRKEVKYTLPRYDADGFLGGDVLDKAPAVPIAFRRCISADKPKRAAVTHAR